MNSETYSLIDTTIKIGLGAIIASLSSYLLTRLNHKSDARKEFYKRYFDTIEKISDSAEDYFQKWSRCISAISGVSKGQIEKGIPVSDEGWKKIRERDGLLIQARDNKMTAISRLKLLGINDAAVILDETANVENELREVVIFECKIPNLKEIHSIQDKMKKKRNLFYIESNKHYNEKKITSS
ncbi:MAG: hypothetical protein HOO91_11990 [Bacteroidales bacterium]|nr:hypothetical protein [Bacteroidales bacterium]